MLLSTVTLLLAFATRLSQGLPSPGPETSALEVIQTGVEEEGGSWFPVLLPEKSEASSVLADYTNVTTIESLAVEGPESEVSLLNVELAAAAVTYVRIYTSKKCTGKYYYWKLSAFKSGHCYNLKHSYYAIMIVGPGSKDGLAATKGKSGNYCNNYSWVPRTNTCYYWNTVKNGVGRSPIP
ncbi:hypothetical protein RQP46_010918 [Phenoliferia psychrophenolica]